MVVNPFQDKKSKIYFKKNEGGNFRVYINGKETSIRGAGGVIQPGMLEEFKAVGGNFTRTWGIETLEEKVKEYNIPIDNLKSIKNGENFTSEDGSVISNFELTIENKKASSYAYCSDTKYCESIIEKVKGVSLLYHEATFMNDRKNRAQETNHSTTIDAATIAKLAEVNYLLIGHFSQRYRDDSLLLEESQSVFKNTMIAKQGQTINFSEM